MPQAESRPRPLQELSGHRSGTFPGHLASLERVFPGHPFTDRVLRLLAETSGDRSRMTARTVGDVSGGSAASASLILGAISWLQTRRLKTQSSFSDRVRRELSNGGSVAQFRSRNEKINTFAIVSDFQIVLCCSRVKAG